MLNCPYLESYLSIPHEERTREVRNEAYSNSYQDLLNWWAAWRKRNPNINDDFVMERIGTVTGVIKELELRKAQYDN